MFLFDLKQLHLQKRKTSTRQLNGKSNSKLSGKFDMLYFSWGRLEQKLFKTCPQVKIAVKLLHPGWREIRGRVYGIFRNISDLGCLAKS